jgi:hypothetical protein
VPVDRVAPRLWKTDAAGAWSLLLSPIFGSVLVRKNWETLGEKQKVRTGTIWIVVSVLMFLVGFFFGFPIAMISLPYIIVWYFAFQRPQSVYVKERWGSEYPRRGWSLPLIATVVIYFGMIALFSMLFALLYANQA